MINFLKHFPAKYKPRKVQERILSKDLPEAWDTHRVFVITVPVAGGKSLIARTIAEALSKEKGMSTAKCVPTIILQEQYANEFPELPMLKGKDRYQCDDPEYSSCHEKAAAIEHTCDNCPYKRDRNACLHSSIGIFNLYSYLFLQDRTNQSEGGDVKDVVILDEAQTVISQLRDMYTFKFWAHKDKYPKDMKTHGDVVLWLESKAADYTTEWNSMEKSKEKEELYRYIDRLYILSKGMKTTPGDYFYEYRREFYRGMMRDCLVIIPFTMRGLTSKLSYSKKIVLMSATLNNFDLEELGLSDKRVKYIEAESEIPVQNRPILFLPAYKASYKTKGEYEKVLANTVRKLLKKHNNKGLIHITYDMIEPLKALLGDEPRLLWHTKTTKNSKYKEFRESTDKVLMAAGMAEGIDLAGVEYEWQVVTKIMFPSLADGMVKRQKENNHKWYSWQACKTLIQQSGRICRTPSDYGITYILDSNFIALYYGHGKEFFPKYFKQSVSEGSRIVKLAYKDFLNE